MLQETFSFEYDFLSSAERTYLNEINKIPILSKEEIYELGIKSMQGDLEARKELIKSQLRLVASIAFRLKKRAKSLELLDLIQYGNMGLMESVSSFDPCKATLSTYATKAIEKAIKRNISDYDDILNRPVYLVEAEMRYKTIISKMPSLTDEEIKKILNVTDQIYDYIKKSKKQDVVSLNKKVGEDFSNELGDLIPEEKNYVDNLLSDIEEYELLILLKEWIKPVEYFFIYKHLITKDSKFKELGDIFGIKEEAVRQKEKIGKDKIEVLLCDEAKCNRKISSIKKREGALFYKLSVLPIKPENVMLYLYLKDYVNELERKVLYEKLLGKYNFNQTELKKYLNINDKRFALIVRKIEILICRTLEEQEFVTFSKELCTTYKTSIYSLNFEKSFR